MTAKFFAIYTSDLPASGAALPGSGLLWQVAPLEKTTSILWHYDVEQKRVVVRPEYRDLTCHKCGKVDELKALSRGIDCDVVIPTRRDAFQSFEGLYILSEKAKDVLSSIPNVKITFYPIPGRKSFFVAMPDQIYLPKEDSDCFRILGRCGDCGRFREALWGPGRLELPNDLMLGCFLLETWRGIAPAWITCAIVVKIVRDAKLKGFDIIPW